MDNLVLVTFDSEAKAYQGLSELKQLHESDAVELHEGAVVVRASDGGLVVKDSIGFDAGSGATTGSIVGMFVGLLAGPLGLLLGWLTGGLLGADADAARSAETSSALAFVGGALPPGSTALIAAVTEPTVDALDAVVKRLGGYAVRQPAETVHNAIVAAQQAEATARESARKVMDDAAAGEWHKRWEEVKAALARPFSPVGPGPHRSTEPVAAPKDDSRGKGDTSAKDTAPADGAGKEVQGAQVGQ
jgi:uncharacterized membrane protein